MRSKFETAIQEVLPDDFEYEPRNFKVPMLYLPDWVSEDKGVILEAKGRLFSEDAGKVLGMQQMLNYGFLSLPSRAWNSDVDDFIKSMEVPMLYQKVPEYDYRLLIQMGENTSRVAANLGRTSEGALTGQSMAYWCDKHQVPWIGCSYKNRRDLQKWLSSL